MCGRGGNSAIFSGFHGETFNCPAEDAEARYGLAVDRLMLNAEQGGEGRWRGGKGIEVAYRVRADGNFMTVGYTRSRIPPLGLAGGSTAVISHASARDLYGIGELGMRRPNSGMHQ
jgi:N-methylhydantoinase B